MERMELKKATDMRKRKESGLTETVNNAWEQIETIEKDIEKFGIGRYLEEVIPDRISEEFGKDWETRKLSPQELSKIQYSIINSFVPTHEHLLTNIARGSSPMQM